MESASRSGAKGVLGSLLPKRLVCDSWSYVALSAGARTGRVIQERPEEDPLVGRVAHPTPPGHTQETQKGLEIVVRAETLPAWTEGAGAGHEGSPSDSPDLSGTNGPRSCLAVKGVLAGSGRAQAAGACSARVRVCVRSSLVVLLTLGRSRIHPVVKYENKSSMSRSRGCECCGWRCVRNPSLRQV